MDALTGTAHRLNYERIYHEFIADRRRREAGITGYIERHHILPRSLGGGNAAENLIRLTAEDHFFAHLLLAKVHGGSMWYALFVMMKGSARSSDRRFLRRARRHYARARSEFIARHGPRMAAIRIGARHSEETKAKIAAGNRKPKSLAAIENMRAALTGRKLSPEHRAKNAAHLTDSRRFAGRTHSEATKARMSRVNQARKQFVARFGGDSRLPTIADMRKVGIDV